MDISKIKIGSTIYDIKDVTARAAAVGTIKLKGTTTTALTDEATTNPIKISNADYTAVANDAVFYGKKEFVFDGTKWHEFGDMSGLGALATKDSASASYTPAGTNAASTVTLTGGSTSKLVTTSITGTNGTETVSAVTSTSSKLATTSITPTNGTESVSKVTKTASKLVTTSLKGVAGTLTTHDTPTLTTGSVGSASGWNAGTMFSATYDNETLTLTAGTVPSLTITSTTVGTGLTAGTAQTVATANSSATTVATGSVASTGTGSDIVTAVTISDKTVAKAGAAVTVATGALDAEDANGASIVATVTATDKTVAKAASAATTVATGQVASNGAGATVATALRTGGTAAAQKFTGTAATITVS